jgi:hypothetical protein
MDDYTKEMQLQQSMQERLLAQQQQQDPNSLYADNMREEKVMNIIQQLNPDNLVEDIEHRIRGEKRNRFNQEWEKINPKSEKVVSDLLIENYISFLSSLLTQNTSLSNFSSQEINNLMMMIVEHIRDDLSDNAPDYGFITKDAYGNDTIDFNEMNRIGMIICGTTFAVFKRAQNGMEARRIFSSLKVSESLNQQDGKKGLLESMKFWK